MTSLAELAGLTRRYAAVERRLFEVLGGWVPSVPEAEAKLLLRAHSFQHAWHADLWEGITPRAGPGSGAVTGAAAGAVGGAAAGAVGGIAAGAIGPDDLLGPLAGASSTVERLAAAYRAVLPDLVGEYLDLRRRAQPASDGPVLRVLGLILADEEAASAAGESLLQVLVGTSDEAGNATSESRRATEVVRKA